jgi:hypothetical protein
MNSNLKPSYLTNPSPVPNQRYPSGVCAIEKTWPPGKPDAWSQMLRLWLDVIELLTAPDDALADRSNRTSPRSVFMLSEAPNN